MAAVKPKIVPYTYDTARDANGAPMEGTDSEGNPYYNVVAIAPEEIRPRNRLRTIARFRSRSRAIEVADFLNQAVEEDRR